MTAQHVCRHCGAAVEAGQRYCGSCGKDLALVCRECGTSNPETFQFCGSCGAPLRAARVAVAEERRIVTVLFADLARFTARAERLDPEDVRAILTPFHARVREEIEAFGGMVEKFIGDAVMAVFGAPVTHGDDPERAVRAALAARDAIAEMNEAEPALDLQVRLAVNTGEAIVTLGARPETGESMVAGDVVNTAARLEAAAPVNGVLVGRETFRCTRSVVEYQPIDPVVAKGKREPVEAWLAVRTLSTPGERRGQSVPIVGRARELTVLHQIWENATGESHPHLVTIFAPAGVGKTRLAAEFCARVRDEGARVLRGRSLPYGTRTAYGPFAQHVKQMGRIFDSDPVDVAVEKLRRAVADLVDADPDSVATHVAMLMGLEAEGEVADRQTLFLSARRLVEAFVRERPTVLLFEDIHWADASTLDLLAMLASRVREVPLLLLAIARPELLESRPGWGGGLPAYTALPLDPLSSEAAKELAERLLGDATIERARARSGDLAALAEGNPLFIEELAASIVERASIGVDELPTTIRGIVAARLDALPHAERSVLLDASVVGKIFWRGALERMGHDGSGLTGVLDSLENRDLMRRESVSRIQGDEQFSFKHVLIRDVAYATLPRAARQQRHADVASFLEQTTAEVGAAAAALAHHWKAAGESEQATRYLLLAAEQAGRGWAKDEAVALYRDALALVPADEAEQRRDIARRLAVAMQAQYHVADARRLAGRED